MPARRFATMLMALLLASCGGLGGEPEIAATLPAVLTDQRSTIATVDWQPDIENGARLFAERCTECHGASGDGRGNLVTAGSVKQPLDMTERAKVAEKSPLEWFEIITKGLIAELMPPWENALSESERWDVTLYSYTLAYDEEWLARGEQLWRERCGDCLLPPLIPPLHSDVDYGAELNRERFGAALTKAEAEAAAAYARMRSLAPGDGQYAPTASDAFGQVRGRVAQGTAGGVLPADTVAQLRFGKGDIGFRIFETTVDGDGNFQFENVPLASDYDYMVGALYAGRLFSRRIAAAELREPVSAPTITVYDETTDPLTVSVARVILSMEPVTLEDLGFGLYISQILTYRNDSDRVYTSGRGFDDGREAALLIQFPKGARLLSGDADGRFVVIEAMEALPDSVIDTVPVLPGEVHNVILTYWLPFAGAAQFDQTFNNLISADVLVTLSDDLRVESDWLRRRPEAMAGEGFVQYGAELMLDDDPRIRFVITSEDDWVVTSETLPALLLGALTLAGALLGAVILVKRRNRGAGSEIDRLLGELARLEEDHDQGRINHDLYHHRRRELKERLAPLMEPSDE